MKKFLLGLFVLALSVMGTLGADLSSRSIAEGGQKFSSLPIGANLDGYISSIQVWFLGGGQQLEDTFQYDRKRDGPLETFANAKLRNLISGFVPKPGKETSPYGWSMDAITDGIGGLLPYYYGESKSAVIATAPPAEERKNYYLTLHNGKWEVPEEVFGKVKFAWGIAVPFHIPTLWNLRVTLYDNQGRVSRFSAQERIADSDNPCELPSVLGGLSVNDAYIPREVALANNAWWTSAEVELLTLNNEQSVTFLVNRTEQDGKAIRWSNPPPSFFIPPSPQIASLKRVFGEITEIVVEGTPNTSAAVEWTEQLNGEWQLLSALVSPLSLNASGRGILTHKNKGVSGFYRVRLAEPQLQR